MSKNQVSPCAQCSFRRDTPPGNLGGSPPEVYIGQIEGPFMIPCHMLCNFDDPKWREKAFKTGQCAGAAIFRANMGLPPGPVPINLLPPDHTTVFSDYAEFLAHHKGISEGAAGLELLKTSPMDHLKRELSDPRIMLKKVEK